MITFNGNQKLLESNLNNSYTWQIKMLKNESQAKVMVCRINSFKKTCLDY